MIITIEGKQGEGKTALAKTILKNKKAVFIRADELGNKEWLLEVGDNIDFLVVDEVTKMEKTKLFLTKNTFSVRKPYERTPHKVKIPASIILIKQD